MQETDNLSGEVARQSAIGAALDKHSSNDIAITCERKRKQIILS